MNLDNLVVAIESQLRRHRHYRNAFAKDGKLTRSGQVILADLKKFCRFGQSTAQVNNYTIDPMTMALLEGRREVFLRIIGFLNLDEYELIKLKESLND